MLEIYDSGIASAKENMEIDRKLMRSLADSTRCILHFYRWKTACATYGYFMDPSMLVKETTALELARRPTGGGMIFHLNDFAFSLLIPSTHPAYTVNTLKNYAFVNGMILEALRKLTPKTLDLLEPELLEEGPTNFCMAKPIQYDLMLHGKKIGGGAQRRTRFGFLHQGTIALAPPPKNMVESCVTSTVFGSIQKNSTALFDNDHCLDDMRVALKQSIIETARTVL